MNNKFLSRKFTLTSAVQLLFFISLWCGFLTQEIFQSLTMVLLSSYLTANVSQKVLTKEKEDETVI